MEFRTLLSALILHTHNVRVLHWNVVGVDFDPVHEKLGEYYDILQNFVDEIAEIGLQLNIYPVGLIESIKILNDDQKSYINLNGSKFFTSTEAFSLINEIFSDLVSLYSEVCKDDTIPSDIINKLEEHQFILRKELQYKNRSRLGR